MTDTVETVVTEDAPETRRRRFRLDPWAWLCFLVALAVYPLQGYDAGLTRDLGVYSYGGQQVADGVAPYVAIVNRAGPLGHLVPGIAAWIAEQVGIDDLFGMRLLMTLISATCVALSYLIGRDLYRSRLAGIAAAAALLSIHGFIIYATDGPREKTSLVLFAMLAALMIIRRRWGWAGFFTALATLTWQPVFLVVAAGAAVTILLAERRRRLRGLVWFAVGGLIPTAITVAFYAAIGELQVFLDDFLIINAKYTRQTSLITRPDQIWKFMTDAYGWSLAVLVGGMLVQLGLAIAVLRDREARRTQLGAAQVGFGVAFVVGIAWSLKAFNGYPDAFFLLPQTVMGIGGLVALLRKRMPVRVVLVATTVWALVATGTAATWAYGNRDDALVDQKADVAAVKALLPSDATWYTVEGPQPLVLAHERSISRYALFGNGLIDYVDATFPGGSEGYGEWVAQQNPTVITLGGGEQPTWLRSTLAASYVRVGKTSKWWVWYINRDVGETTLQEIRSALHDQ